MKRFAKRRWRFVRQVFSAKNKRRTTTAFLLIHYYHFKKKRLVRINSKKRKSRSPLTEIPVKRYSRVDLPGHDTTLVSSFPPPPTGWSLLFRSRFEHIDTRRCCVFGYNRTHFLECVAWCKITTVSDVTTDTWPKHVGRFDDGARSKKGKTFSPSNWTNWKWKLFVRQEAKRIAWTEI